MKTLYAALDSNKEPPKPIEKATKTKENEAKKAQKKQKEKKESSVKENNKPPKTIEAAVALVRASFIIARYSRLPLNRLRGI